MIQWKVTLSSHCSEWHQDSLACELKPVFWRITFLLNHLHWHCKINFQINVDSEEIHPWKFKVRNEFHNIDVHQQRLLLRAPFCADMWHKQGDTAAVMMGSITIVSTTQVKTHHSSSLRVSPHNAVWKSCGQFVCSFKPHVQEKPKI